MTILNRYLGTISVENFLIISGVRPQKKETVAKSSYEEKQLKFKFKWNAKIFH